MGLDDFQMELICIAPDPWSGLRRRRYNLMSRLARFGKVLYVDPFVSRRELAPTAGMPILHVRPNLYVISASYPLPLHRYRPIAFVNGVLVCGILANAVKKLGFRTPIVWAHNLPNVEMAISRLEKSLLCYDVFDKTSAYAPYSRRQSAEAEGRHIRLLRRADVVFAVSPRLYEDCARHSSNVHLVPNGVDVDLFSRTLSDKANVPDDLRGIRRPIVCYLGAIYDKVDFRLLIHLASSRPDWSIVLIGPQWVTHDIKGRDCLKQQPNVYFLGEKPQHELPRYLSAVDVGLLPYKAAYQVPYCSSPLKLLEYLAAGVPTVATGFEPMSLYAGVVEVATGADDFVEKVRELMEADNTVRIQRGIEIAAANSWDRSVEQIKTVIQDRLAARGRAAGTAERQ